MDTPALPPPLQLALDASFGSLARWRDDFTACAQAGGGVVLCWLPQEGRLANRPAAGDDVALLALDGPDVDAGIAATDWPAVHARYQQAVHAASEALGVDAAALPGATVLDVRRAAAFAQAASTIPDAAWRDPATVSDWAAALGGSQAVVVYCMHGHEVSRATALRLRAAGVEAHFLRGGIEGWASAGLPLVAKP